MFTARYGLTLYSQFTLTSKWGRSMAQEGSRQTLKAEAWVRYENIPFMMCGGHNEVL